MGWVNPISKHNFDSSAALYFPAIEQPKYR